MKAPLPVLLFPALLGACFSPSGSVSTSSTFLLAERTSEDGMRTTFRVHSDRRAGPSIARVETRSLQAAFLGLQVRSLERSSAQALGLEPWKGVIVVEVDAGSAAELAGLRSGDVLQSLAGEELSNAEEFRDVVGAELQPGVAVPGSKRRRSPTGEYVEESLQITPGARTISDSTTEHLQLEAPPEILERTGMQVATIEAELAREAGLGDSSLALVTGVIAGASAYDEGVRGGDVILECNGARVAGAQDVLAALSGGAKQLHVLVDGPLGEHRARIGTDEDVDARTRLHIPIVLDHRSRVDETRTSFLDFIFQFGFNYSRKVRDAETREPSKETYLSFFPLGMFEFHRTPEGSRNTLFWFITWNSN